MIDYQALIAKIREAQRDLEKHAENPDSPAYANAYHRLDLAVSELEAALNTKH